MRNETSAHISPEYLFVVTRSDEGTWTAIGSRKVHFFQIEAKYDDWSYPLGLDSWNVDQIIRNQEIKAEINGFICVTGHSYLSALGALLDALREEEEQERVRKALFNQVREEQEKKAKKKAKKNKKKGKSEESLYQSHIDWIGEY